MKLIRKLIERLKDQQGVTLVELLAVIVILGIIAAIGIPALMDSREQAQRETFNTNAKIMTEAAKRKLLMGQKYAGSDVTDDDKEFNLEELITEANIGHGTIDETTPDGEGEEAGSATAFVDSDDSQGYYELDVATGTVTFNEAGEEEAVEEQGNEEENTDELQDDENSGQSLNVEREQPAQSRP